MSISGVFESAQRAAERYLADVKSARGDADAILSSAREQAAQIERDAQDKANAREQAADESIRAKEAEFQKRCNCVVAAEALRKLIGDDSRPASADSKLKKMEGKGRLAESAVVCPSALYLASFCVVRKTTGKADRYILVQKYEQAAAVGFGITGEMADCCLAT